MVRFDLHAFHGFGHRHCGFPREEIGQHALVPRIEVLDVDEGKTGVGRKLHQKLGKCFQPAGGSAYAYDRKASACGFRIH